LLLGGGVADEHVKRLEKRFKQPQLLQTSNWARRPGTVIGRPDFVAAKPPVRSPPTHLTGGFAARPAAAFPDLDVFPAAGLTTVVKPNKMPA
jgi:hypothetical protein